MWIVMQTYLAPGSIEYLDLCRHIVDGDAVPVEEICDKRQLCMIIIFINVLSLLILCLS